jgi:hypothetical protein
MFRAKSMFFNLGGSEVFQTNRINSYLSSQKKIGSCKVPCNPPEDFIPVDSELTITADSLGLSNGYWVKSYHLLMQISLSTFNGLTNRDNELSEIN